MIQLRLGRHMVDIIQYPSGYWMYMSNGRQQRIGYTATLASTLRIIINFWREK